jgi:hypothetical protein
MKRLLTTLVLLLLLAFAGFKAAVWWLTDQRMAEARSALEHQGVLSRGRIGSGLDGHLVLSDGYWQDFRLTQPLAFGRVVFDAGSPLALLRALLDPADLPLSWTLQAEGLGLVLDANLLRNWVTADGEDGQGRPALMVLPCAPDTRQQLGSGDLMRMGITGLAGEALIRQDADGVRAELNTAGVGSLELVWPGARLNVRQPSATLSSTANAMTVTLRDGGLMRRVTAYCARETGLEPQAWADRVTAALAAGLRARGVAASEPLRALYRQWLLEGGELTLSLWPSRPWWGIPVRADAGEGAAWPVSYNGRAVPGLYLTALPPSTSPPEAVVGSGSPPPEAGAPDREGWSEQPLADADAWLGYRIRVTLDTGKVVEGRLDAVDERELSVARRMAGGEVVYPILRRAVSRLEIGRPGRSH